MRHIEHFKVAIIETPANRRKLDDDTVTRLTESIKSIGMRTPITVRIVDEYTCSDGEVADGVPVLVTGAHRLEAAKRLGWEEVECFLFGDEQGDDELTARRWEIAENLHRAELTALERDQHIAEWIRLTEEAEKKLTQDVSVSKGGRGKESGIRKAARDLNVNREDARRAVKVDGLTDEAKEAARETGLDKNRSALLKAASRPAEEQAGAIREIAERKRPAERPKGAAKTPEHPEWTMEDERSYAAILDGIQALLNEATPNARQQFRREYGWQEVA